MTNFEKLKNMSVDQLAEKLNESLVCYCCPIKEFCNECDSTPELDCIDICKEWLKSEVQNNERFERNDESKS